MRRKKGSSDQQQEWTSTSRNHIKMSATLFFYTSMKSNWWGFYLHQAKCPDEHETRIIMNYTENKTLCRFLVFFIVSQSLHSLNAMRKREEKKLDEFHVVVFLKRASHSTALVAVLAISFTYIPPNHPTYNNIIGVKMIGGKSKLIQLLYAWTCARASGAASLAGLDIWRWKIRIVPNEMETIMEWMKK